MTRTDILMRYNVDGRGVIKSPGKFEGERLYVPFFWDAYLNGFAGGDHCGILSFDVSYEDKKEFPELRRREVVKLSEREDGFVVEVIS